MSGAARTLAAASLATAGFAVVAHRSHLEDTRFLVGLGAFCVLAAILAAAATLASRRDRNRWLGSSCGAAVLVPLLYAGYIAVRFALCVITECDKS